MGLADLAVAVVQPLLKEKLRSWDPLKVCVCNSLLLGGLAYHFLKLIIGKLPLFILFFRHFRTALFVWKTSVSGEQSWSPETFTAVPQIQTWTLTTGNFTPTNLAVHQQSHDFILLAWR